jgi:hypothetical protein
MKLTQTCSSCSTELELSKDNFYPSKESPTGYHHECRKCSLSKWKAKEDYYQKIATQLHNPEAQIKAGRKKAILTKSKQKAMSVLEKGEKECTHCKEDKPLESFYKRVNKTQDGYQRYSSWCKECSSKLSSDRYNSLPSLFKTDEQRSEELK